MNESLQQHLVAPEQCPYCGQPTVEGASVEIESDQAQQNVHCLSCSRQWWDIYGLSAILDDSDRLHERTRTPATASQDTLPDRDLRQRDIVPPDRLAQCQATVVGVGAIGRQVAMQLTAMGVSWMQFVDPDTVETVNLACQGYWRDDIGRAKVEATGEVCHKINPMLELYTSAERFRSSMEVGNCLFLCVDSIDTRRFIWDAVKDRVNFLADGRMSAEVIRVVTATNAVGPDHYPTTLFHADEVQAGSCTAKSTIFTANIAAGLMLEQFSRWLRHLPVDPDIQLNLLSSEMTVAGV